MDEKEKKDLLWNKLSKMKESEEIKEFIQLDVKDDVGLALVETNAGRRMWFAYRFAGKIWNFNGFIKDSAKIE